MDKFHVEQSKANPQIYLWHFIEAEYDWDELIEFHKLQKALGPPEEHVVIGVFNNTTAPSLLDIVEFVRYMYRLRDYPRIPCGIIVTPITDLARTWLDVVNSVEYPYTGKLYVVDTIEEALIKATAYLEGKNG